jgi:glucokinase
MYLLFDIGGTKMRLALSDGEKLSESVILPTPQKFDEGISLFIKTVKELTKGEKLKLSVGGIRRLDKTKSMLVPDFRLPDWSGKPLKEKLVEVTSAPVYLENDTALVGLGEALQGAGKGFRIVAYLTVSSGVGGVRIVEGKIDKNIYGFEPGHQIIDLDWSKHPELKDLEKEGFGQLEAYISGVSLEKRFGKLPKDINDEVLWDEVEQILAFALKNTVVYWSPEVIVLGGGMFGSPGISIDKVKNKLEKTLKIFPEIPKIKKAELGDIGGLYGSLYYLKQLKKSTP